MLCCNTLMQFNLEWKRSGKSHTAQLIYPDRNGTVHYLAVSTHTLGPVHLIVGRSESFCSYHVIHTYSKWWDSERCFVCWSTPEVISFSWIPFLLLDPEYRVQYPASHTKHSVSASRCYWHFFPPFLTSKKTPYAGLMEVWPQILNVILKKQWQHLNVIYKIKKSLKSLINYSIPLLTHDNICLPTLGNRQQARIPTVTHTHLPAPPPPPPPPPWFFTIWHHPYMKQLCYFITSPSENGLIFFVKHFHQCDNSQKSTLLIWHTVEPSTLLQTRTQSRRESSISNLF